jgi:hypothetical protein
MMIRNKKRKLKSLAATRVALTKTTNPRAKTRPVIEKSPYPRLTDPALESGLEKLFNPYFQCFYSAPAMCGYLSQAVATFFNNTAVFHLPQDVGLVNHNTKKPDHAYLEHANVFAKLASANGFDAKMKIFEKNVILYTKPVKLEFQLSLPGPTDKEKSADLMVHLRKLFPAFNTPRSWVCDPGKSPPINLVLGEDKVTTGWQNLDKYNGILHSEEMKNQLSYTPEKINFAEQN